MTQFSLYAVARALPGAPTARGNAVATPQGDYDERLYLDVYGQPDAALTALFLAYERRTCFARSRGWYEPPADLRFELWLRDRRGLPMWTVARTEGETLHLARDFLNQLPGRDPQPAYDSFARDYTLVTHNEPTRSSLLRRVITPGGTVAAKGA